MQIYHAFLHSLAGLRAGFSGERAIRQELCLLVLSVPVSLVVAKAGWVALLLVAAMLAVVCVELINTAIERLCDFVHPTFDWRIKNIKDIASAACLCIQVAAGIVWIAAGWFRFAAP